MAEIWLAKRRSVGGAKVVIIKKILDHLSSQPTFVRMFLDEARTSAQLDHPNIVRIFDLGVEQDSYYIAMERIDGQSLSALIWAALQQGQPLAPALAARIIAEAARGLDYAHTLHDPQGRPLSIVHRDVSPQNVLVNYAGEVKVVDFGIAKAATQSEETKTGMLKGKFSYMSPEQCTGEKVDARSDVFALGVLLYELATSKRLFKHNSELMILEMITQRPVLRPSKVNPEISRALEAIILKALNKKPEDRFQSAGELQAAIESYLRTEPTPTTQAALAALMERLFSDEILARKRVLEDALLDDFEERYGISESAQRSTPSLPPQRRAALEETRVEQGPSVQPAQVPTGPVVRPAKTQTYSEAPAQAKTPPSESASYSPTPAPAPRPRRRRAQRIALGLAAAVTLIAIGVLAEPLLSPGPARAGQLSIDSSPQGAHIYLDGRALIAADGAPRTTPHTFEALPLGEPLQIELQLPGHRSARRQVRLDRAHPAQALNVALSPRTLPLQISVQAPNAAAARIWVNGEVFDGPEYEAQRAEGEAIELRARVPGARCPPSEPFSLRAPGRRLTIRCTPKRAVATAPPPPPRKKPRAVKRRAARPAKKAPTRRAAVSPASCVKVARSLTINVGSKGQFFQFRFGGGKVRETPYSGPLPAGSYALYYRQLTDAGPVGPWRSRKLCFDGVDPNPRLLLPMR